MSKSKDKINVETDNTDIKKLIAMSDGGLELDINLAEDLASHSEETDNSSKNSSKSKGELHSFSTEMILLSSDSHRKVDKRKQLAKMSNDNFMDLDEMQRKGIIHPDMQDYSIMNNFREIRTRLLQKSSGKNFVLMVVSLQHGMGATFTAVNIAAAFSYEGEKTSLIVDCNQRHPKLDSIFEAEITHGLTDYLDEPDMDMDKIIYSTGINRMRFVPIGKRNIAGEEFLSSEKMREFVMTMKKRYLDRFIILNAPPLETSADAAILSEIADYIAIVVPYGKVTKTRITKAVKLLPPEKVSGFILNYKKKYV